MLQRPDLSDGEAEAILENLYSVALVVADAYLERQRPSLPPSAIAVSECVESIDSLVPSVA